ncbi:MAG: hypothetical protein ACRCZ2_13865 [Fusobacteriaceae bacterium]
MTTAEKKIFIAGVIEKMERSQEREFTVQKELANDEVALNRVLEMIRDGETLPSNSGYLSLAEWKKALEKQIATSHGSLQKLADDRVEIEAFKFYVENVS